MVHVFKNDATLRNVFPDLYLRRSFAANRKTSSANRKDSSNVAECCFWRSLPKMWKASKFRIFRRSGTAAHVRICIMVHTYVRRFMWCITAALSNFVKQRIVSLKERGLTNCEVVAILKREGDMVHVTTQVVRRCHKLYVEAGSIICEATRIRKANSAHCCPSSYNWRHNASWRRGDCGSNMLLFNAAKPEAPITQHDFGCPTLTGLDVPRVSVLSTYSPGKQRKASWMGTCSPSWQFCVSIPSRFMYGLAWSYRNLHFWWDNGCSNVRQDCTGSSPACPSTPRVWERSSFYPGQ